MPRYETIFIVRHLDNEMAEMLYDTDLDCFVATDFDERHTVTITCPGPNAIDAAKAMMTRLHQLGLQIEFVQHDLVTRSEIAERLDVSRTAVTKWVSRERDDTPFPAGFSDAAGGIWLWGDVVRWRRAIGATVDDELEYPTRAELDCINDFIRSGCLPAEARHHPGEAAPVFSGWTHVQWLGDGHGVSLDQPRMTVRRG